MVAVAMVVAVMPADVILLALRAATTRSVVEIISTTTRSATATNGIALPTSAEPAGEAGAEAGAVGEDGSDRCSGRFSWETFFRALSGPTPTATRSGPTASLSPTTMAPMRQLMATAVRPTFTVTARVTDTHAVLCRRIRSLPT